MGDIWFDAASGINRPPQKRGIGFVFQIHRLFPNLTVEENIRFPVLLGNRKPLLAFDELINLLGIEKLLPFVKKQQIYRTRLLTFVRSQHPRISS